MRSALAVVCLALTAGVASAQQAAERVPHKEAQKYAKLFVEQAAKVNDLQLGVHPDADKAFGVTIDVVTALVIPDMRLSEQTLRKAGNDVTPLGQYWTRNATLVVNRQPVPNEQLRMVTITVDGDQHRIPLFLLAARKRANGALELALYGKGKEPLLFVPLQTAESKQEMPIELKVTGHKGRGIVTVNILGKYQARLEGAVQAP